MKLFAFFVTAIADSAEGRRPGARHAMLVYVTAENFEAAQSKAAVAAIALGWMTVRLEKGGEIDDAAAGAQDEVMQAAMQTAREDGSAIVVYGDELPAQA
jgi:hypothetical protein